MTHKELMEIITQKVSGKCPPWVKGYSLTDVLPRNISTGKLYQGGNMFMGMFLAMEYGSNLFGTNQQWYELAVKLGYFDKFPGGRLLKRTGEKDPKTGRELTVPGETFVFAKNGKRKLKEGEECPEEYLIHGRNGEDYRKFFIYNTFLVYNLMQLDDNLIGLVQDRMVKKPENNVSYPEFDKFVSAIKAVIEERAVGVYSLHGPSPCYSPKLDKIFLMPQSSYQDLNHFVTHKAHELGHWTGHESRLNRESLKSPAFGTDPYAREEAVAHWFALLCCNHFEMAMSDDYIVNNASYLQGWTKRFAEVPTLLYETFKEAEKAFVYAMKMAGIETNQVIEETEQVA
jgi:antirestriction protein ArdC